MYRYIIKRVLLMIPIVIGISFIIFAIMAMIPGNPGRTMLGIQATQEQVDALNEQLGVTGPFFERYFKYMFNAIFKLDFGISYMTRSAVFPEIMSRLPVTALLAFCAIAFSVVVGTPIGVLSAVKQNSALDVIPSGVALLLASLPTFFVGMMLMLWFSLELGWLPPLGIGSVKHYILPVLSIGLPYAAYQLRFTRSSMLETIRQDYVRTARAKGAKQQTVIWKHAMKNALLPVVTVAGNNFGLLLGGAVTIETLFSLPGLGLYTVTGIFQRDMPVVMGSIIIVTLMYSIVILLVDILYAFLDPRVKAKYARRA